MARPTSLRSWTAAFLPPLILAACGGSQEGAKPSPATAPAQAAPPPSAAAPQAPPQPVQARAVPVGSAAPAHRDAASQRPVATVNGKPITAERVYSMYQMNKSMLQQRGRVLSETDDQALKAESLEVVLADELLYQDAVAKGIEAGAGEIDTALRQFKARVGSEEAYTKFIAGEGLTEADVRSELERNIQTEAYRRGLVGGKAVSEEQAKKYYETNAPKGMFNVPERVHVQYILVRSTDKDSESARGDARKRAEEAARRAASGEDFAALAKQYSQDPTAARGGDIGLVPRGVMFPKFEEVAFSAAPGSVSPVFETPKGFNVVKVLEKKPESTQTYEDVKKALMAELGRLLERDIVEAKVQELAKGAKIAVFDRSFAPPAQAPPPQPVKP